MRLQDVLVLINEMEIPYAEKFSSPSIQKVSAILSQEFRCLSTHFKHQAKGVDTVLSYLEVVRRTSSFSVAYRCSLPCVVGWNDQG